jgi:uncharacterized protein
MKSLALAAIRFYQKTISPRKGFCCAYAAYTGHGSCSALGYRAIRRFGVWRGLFILDGRLTKCGITYRRYRAAPVSGLSRQAGFLDCDCAGCDLPGDCNAKSAGSSLCDVGDCLSSCGDCDWKKKKRKRAQEQYVIIPPRTTRLR